MCCFSTCSLGVGGISGKFGRFFDLLMLFVDLLWVLWVVVGGVLLWFDLSRV